MSVLIPPPPAPSVPLVKLQKAVHAREYWHTRARILTRALKTSPDFEVSMQLAGIAYGVDWHHLESCALSEGGRLQERYMRFNARPNAAGSGATGLMQFMRGTFLSTPFASLDWTRQDVQAFAAGWMFSRGRSNEWTGGGC